MIELKIEIKDVVLLEKLARRQTSISTNEDISGYGYDKSGMKGKIQTWKTKEKNNYYAAINDPINNPLRQRYKGKRVILLDDRRNKWRCAVCGMDNMKSRELFGCQLTGHHVLYDDNDPSKYRIPLCAVHHPKEHANTLSLDQDEQVQRIVEEGAFIQ